MVARKKTSAKRRTTTAGKGERKTGSNGNRGLRSMTGYGRAAVDFPEGAVVAEVRSVNGRFLKLNVKAPPRLGKFEDLIRKSLGKLGLRRGSVDIYVGIGEGFGGSGSAYELNAKVIEEYLRQMRKMEKALKVERSAGWADLLALPGALVKQDNGADLGSAWKRFEPVLIKAFGQFDAMRDKEGRAMAKDVGGRLDELKKHHGWLLKNASKVKKEAVEKFKTRIQEMLAKSGTEKELKVGLVEREVVLLSDKMDISEELARLASHFEQMDSILQLGGEVGKKLDFLTQELFREVNTIGSKAQNQDVTHRVVDMKGLVEKIREQVQNLE